jgi:hypothetical protein
MSSESGISVDVFSDDPKLRVHAHDSVEVTTSYGSPRVSGNPLCWICGAVVSGGVRPPVGGFPFECLALWAPPLSAEFCIAVLGTAD